MAFTRSIVKNTTENMNIKRETGDFWIKCGYEALFPKLRMDILELASELQPGETRELNLKVFIFRKTGKDKLSMNKDNPFARKDSLVK